MGHCIPDPVQLSGAVDIVVSSNLGKGGCDRPAGAGQWLFGFEYCGFRTGSFSAVQQHAVPWRTQRPDADRIGDPGLAPDILSSRQVGANPVQPSVFRDFLKMDISPVADRLSPGDSSKEIGIQG